jgi:hypothetical protein
MESAYDLRQLGSQEVTVVMLAHGALKDKKGKAASQASQPSDDFPTSLPKVTGLTIIYWLD